MPETPAALIVFAKVPEPGRVKTRLTTLLSETDAARLYAAFLTDALAQYRHLECRVRLYLDRAVPEPPPAWLPAGIEVCVQRGEGLGARMQQAFLESFAAGATRLVIIGTDHPTLPLAFVEAAFAALNEVGAICLGPSDDGGYYLLGMNEFYPQLFAEMTYSHAEVFAQTLDRAATTNAAVTILPPWYDVDTPEALHRLRADLAETDAALPATRACLTELATRYELG